MSVLSHGSDVSLAPTLEPLARQAGVDIKAALRLHVAGRFPAVQLDATQRGLRPRDLDQTGRRDVVATLTRAGLRLAGLDALIPRRDYTDPAKQDRAASATLAVIELAADLGRAPVSLQWPMAMDPAMRDAFVAKADGMGVTLAIHAEGEFEALLAWAKAADRPCAGVGMDPAATLAHGADPVQRVHASSAWLSVARVADVSSADAGALRCPVGEGELDTVTYRLAVDLCPRRFGPVVLDLRGLADPIAAAMAGRAAWERAAATLR